MLKNGLKTNEDCKKNFEYELRLQRDVELLKIRAKIFNEIKKKKFTFNNQAEDIHMSIEKRLFEIIGEDAGYVHTARSRNDQVLVDFKLWMIEATEDIIKELRNRLNKLRGKT